MAALPDGRVITGGDDRRVLVWDLAQAGTPIVQLDCSVTTLAIIPPGPAGSRLLIAHEAMGSQPGRSGYDPPGLPPARTSTRQIDLYALVRLPVLAAYSEHITKTASRVDSISGSSMSRNENEQV